MRSICKLNAHVGVINAEDNLKIRRLKNVNITVQCAFLQIRMVSESQEANGMFPQECYVVSKRRME